MSAPNVSDLDDALTMEGVGETGKAHDMSITRREIADRLEVIGVHAQTARRETASESVKSAADRIIAEVGRMVADLRPAPRPEPEPLPPGIPTRVQGWRSRDITEAEREELAVLWAQVRAKRYTPDSRVALVRTRALRFMLALETDGVPLAHIGAAIDVSAQRAGELVKEARTLPPPDGLEELRETYGV